MSTIQVPDSSLAFEQAVMQLNCRVKESNWFQTVLGIIEVVADVISIASAVIAAYWIYHALAIGRNVHYPMHQVIAIAFAFGVLFAILLDHDGAYRRGNSLLRIRESERALRVSCQAFLLVFPVTFFAAQLLSRVTLVLAVALVPLFLIIQKQLLFISVRALHTRGYGVENVLIYGAGYTGRRVFSALIRSTKLGLRPVALIDDDDSQVGQHVYEADYRRERSVEIVAGPISPDVIRTYGASLVVIAIPSLGREKFAQAVHAAASANARVAFVPSQIVRSDISMDYADIDGLLLSSFATAAPRKLYEYSKRFLDCCGALALLLLAAPLLLLVAVLIRLDSIGPVLFSQKRVGKDGREFKLYKFRSMRVDAPAYAFSPKETADPRITRVGRFLRRSSLDELPQLLNVLRGEMSLVGPRPEMPFIVEQYEPRHRQRLRVKPGITGLWQLSADRAFLIHENIQYDLYYIHHRNFFMDIAILLHTLVFAMRGV